ncbi:MAG: hypothetical protein DKT66_02965 [Candidatus Melainabacteria bacterium]|nr:MAG: hypothetical protein DKT66_02965 [Candidatus Melainabacteria bacterium]
MKTLATSIAFGILLATALSANAAPSKECNSASAKAKAPVVAVHKSTKWNPAFVPKKLHKKPMMTPESSK